MLVVMAPVFDISIIDLYAAAFGPGFLLSAMFIAYTLIRCRFQSEAGSAGAAGGAAGNR